MITEGVWIIALLSLAFMILMWLRYRRIKREWGETARMRARQRLRQKLVYRGVLPPRHPDLCDGSGTMTPLRTGRR